MLGDTTFVIILYEHEVLCLAIFFSLCQLEALLLEQLLLPCIIAAPEYWGVYYYYGYCVSFFVGRSPRVSGARIELTIAIRMARVLFLFERLIPLFIQRFQAKESIYRVSPRAIFVGCEEICPRHSIIYRP